jgi:uncharacterized protein
MTPSARRDVTLAFVLLAALVAAAWWTRLWVITAVPIGFLLGFLLQKGDLCGASAFSEIVLTRDLRKTGGLWVAIVVSMVVFALFERLGWLQLAPKPVLWINDLVGGAIFGVGMVLAGGCISGCLFKAGAGNLNSMAALVGMPLGIQMVESGPLSGLNFTMTNRGRILGSEGAITLSSVSGLPYWVLSIGFAGATLAWYFLARTKRSSQVPRPHRRGFWPFLTGPWKPWQAGLAFGLLAGPAYLSAVASGRNYPMGTTGGVTGLYQLLTRNNIEHVFRIETLGMLVSASRPRPISAGPRLAVTWWLVLLVVSMLPGSWLAARLSGVARLLPRPPGETIVAFFGGILVGVGAGFGTGCLIGNVLSGWALMSVGMFIFGVAVILANWITTYFYLMGGGFDIASLRAVLGRRPQRVRGSATIG